MFSFSRWTRGHLFVPRLSTLGAPASIPGPLSLRRTAQIVRSPLIGSYVDNPIWQAPEIHLNAPYDQSVDTYAFGPLSRGPPLAHSRRYYFVGARSARSCLFERELDD